MLKLSGLSSNNVQAVSSENGFVFKRTLRLILGLGLSALCIYFLLGSIEKQEVIDRFKNVNVSLLVGAFIVTIFSYFLRTIRWKYFFTDTSYSFVTLFRALILGFFMNNVLPARIGELVRCHSLGRRTGLSRTFVLATVAAERLADGVTISAIFGLFFYFSSLTGDSSFYIGLVAVLFFVASIFVIICLLVRKQIFSILYKLDKVVNKSSFTYLVSKIEKFVSGLEPLLHAGLAKKMVLFSIAVWGIELFAYYLIANAFSEKLDLGSLSLFLASVNFASLIPAAPGGVGVIENFASLALHKSGIDYESAVAMVVAQHSIQYLAVGLPGIYFSIKNNQDAKVI